MNWAVSFICCIHSGVCLIVIIWNSSLVIFCCFTVSELNKFMPSIIGFESKCIFGELSLGFSSHTGIIKVMLWVCKDVQCNGNEFINHVNTVSLMQFSLSTVCNNVSSKTGYITVKSQLTSSTIEIQIFHFWKLSRTLLYLNFILFFKLLKI